MAAGEEFFPAHEVFVGRDLGGRRTTVTRADVDRYGDGTGDRHPWYHGDSPFGGPIAPALLYHSEVYRDLSWYLPNLIGNLHARQEWELFHPLPRRRRRALALDRRRALPQAQPRLRRQRGAVHRRPTDAGCSAAGRTRASSPRRPRARWSSTATASAAPTAASTSASGPARRSRRSSDRHARDVRGVLRPDAELPHRSRDGARARLPRHRRAGDDVGLLRRRAHDAGLRRRLVPRRQARRAARERRLGRASSSPPAARSARSSRRAAPARHRSTSGARRPTAP